MSSKNYLYSLLATTLVSGCFSGAPDKNGSRIRGGLNEPAAEATIPAEQPDANSIDANKAPTELLQKAVARVLAFADIEGKQIIVYQDAQSTLFNSSMKAKHEVAGSSADPLFYYSPVFIPDVPKVTLIANNTLLKITWTNRITPEVVRGAVVSKLEGVLNNPENVRVGIIPLENVEGSLKAYNQSFKVVIPKDLTKAIVEIPIDAIPKDVLGDFDPTDPETAELDVTALLESFDTLPIKYDYFVQAFKEATCQVFLDDAYINNMFQDSSCPNLIKKGSEIDIEKVANESLIKDKIKNIAPLIKQVQRPVTACLAGKEASKIINRASVKCTKHSAVDSDGSTLPYSNEILEILGNSIEPMVTNARLGPDMNTWDEQAALAAVALFGSPESFQSEVKRFNNEVLNEKESTKREQALDALKTFVQKIIDSGSSNANANSSSSNKSGGGGLNLGFFKIGGSSGSSNSNSSKSMNEAFNFSDNMELKDKMKMVDDFFREKGVQHEFETTGGQLKIIPHLDLNVAADVNKVKQAASAFTTNELGQIVRESEEITMVLKRRKELKVSGRVKCDGVEQGFTLSALEIDWHNSELFFKKLGEEASSKLSPNGCKSLTASVFYVGAESNGNLVPSSLILNIVVQSKAGGPSPQSAYGLIELKPTTSVTRPAISSNFQVPASGDPFREIVFKAGR